MRSAQMCALVCVLALAVTPSVSATANPLGKVFELMSTLTAKITAEGEAEAKAFGDYVEWCDNAAANLRNEIKTGGEKKEELDATISKCKADIESSSVKILDLSRLMRRSSRQPQPCV